MESWAVSSGPRCANTRRDELGIENRWNRAAAFWSAHRTSLGACVVVIAFAFSRAVYFARGVRFDASPLSYFAQLLDVTLLRERLGESLFYLHSQPPLYNALSGIALKVAPNAPDLVLTAVFLACGVYAALCLYVILLHSRLPVLIAAAVASAVAASPLFVLFENWYFYPHLNVTWLLGAGAWLVRSRGRPGIALGIAAAHLAGLCLTRSLFHPLFFGLVALTIALVAARGTRRRVLACFAGPGLLLLLLCYKNQTLFGVFGTSSWASRNIWRAVVAIVGPDRVQAEARGGKLSPASTLSAFEPGDRNIAAFSLAPRTTGIPALDNAQKSIPSVLPVNHNHWSYPASASYYARDARHLVATYPATYLSGLVHVTLPRFFGAIDQDGFVLPNRLRIVRAADAFDEFEASRGARWFLALGLMHATGVALSRYTPRAERALLAFAFLTMLWVTLVGVAGEFGENHRFRYNILWLAWAVAIGGHMAALRLFGGVLRVAIAQATRSPRRGSTGRDAVSP